jgi:hypothetical protein
MAEHLASLGNWSLAASGEAWGALALLMALFGLVLARSGRTSEDDGLEAEARRWILGRIDQHVDVLAEAYGEGGRRSSVDELPPGFAATIESFIAEVLLHERGADLDVDLSMAIREFVVLHRAEVYADVAIRIRKHLAAA